MDRIWKGAFAPFRKATDGPPPYDIPLDDELEVWDGRGDIEHGVFTYEGETYIAVQFEHIDECYDGEDAPSNDTIYVYLYRGRP